MARIEAKHYLVVSDSTFIGPHWRPNVFVLNKTSGEASYVQELVGFRMRTRKEAEDEAERWAMEAAQELEAVVNRHDL